MAKPVLVCKECGATCKRLIVPGVCLKCHLKALAARSADATGPEPGSDLPEEDDELDLLDRHGSVRGSPL